MFPLFVSILPCIIFVLSPTIKLKLKGKRSNVTPTFHYNRKTELSCIITEDFSIDSKNGSNIETTVQHQLEAKYFNDSLKYKYMYIVLWNKRDIFNPTLYSF